MNASRDRFRSLLLVLAVALLVLCELGRTDPAWRKPLFLAHLGAFLLWQPVVAPSRAMGWRDTLLVAAGAAAITLLLNPWIMLLWTAFVTSLVAGRVFDFAPRQERWLHLAALALLATFLFALVLPDLLPEPLRTQAVAPAVRGWIETGLGAALLFMLVEGFRLARVRRSAHALAGMYDLVHSVWMLLMLLVVSFFGIALIVLGGRGYLASIGITLVSVGGLLLAADLLWRRTPGMERGGGIGMMFSRYLLSYAIPYEQWLERLSRLSRDEPDPAQFFEAAIRALAELAQFEGAAWLGAVGPGAIGNLDVRHAETFEIPVPDDPGSLIAVRVAARHRMSAALRWHVRLLIQVAVQFHAAKAREERLRFQQHLRVVHETGARLTHDVKNLLQSLEGLVAAAATLPEDREVRRLLQRQLPEISRRLAQTLAKLRQPGVDTGERAALADWWAALRAQYEASGVRFQAGEIGEGPPVPVAAFSGVADNLMQNALQKRKAEPGLSIRAALEIRGQEVRFSVADDGSAIDPETKRRLLRSPVASRNGLGIGLYQMARLADAQGLQLQLAENRQGCVRFELVYRVAGAAPASEAAAPVSEVGGPIAERG